MGIADGLDPKDLVDKVKDAVSEHGEQVDHAVDKVAELADQATGGKFSDQIDKAAQAAKDAADKLGN